MTKRRWQLSSGVVALATLAFGCLSPRDEPVEADAQVSAAPSDGPARPPDAGASMTPTSDGPDAAGPPSEPDLRADDGQTSPVDAPGSESTVAGTFTEFDVPGSSLTTSTQLGRIISGPDRALWFTRNDAKIGRMSTAGDVTLFALPDRTDRPYDIVAGQDGNIWFSLVRPAIGRITVTGAILIYETKDPTLEMTVGPDGALWFGQGQEGIGRLSTEGGFKFIAMPGVSVGDVATGGDGHLWATTSITAAGQANVPHVSRISLTGTHTDYPTGGKSAFQILRGPDGAMWCTLTPPTTPTSTTAIARVPMTGPFIEVVNRPRALDLIPGPDGHLWLHGTREIVRMTLQGTITEHLVPAETDWIAGMTFGSDGALWLTDARLGKIRRLSM